MNLTQSQKEALEALEEGRNVFLTGEAGTGKSFLLNHFVTKLKNKNVLLTAPTGIAALNIGGVTLHRTFKLETDVLSLAEEPNINVIPEAVFQADVLIIDEISMCRMDVFEKVLKSVKIAGKKTIQIILVGDFLQLPPVLVDKEAEVYEQIHGNRLYAFQSKMWKQFNFVTKRLVEVVRQKGDLEFIDNLNKARLGDVSCIEYFNNLSNEKASSVIEVCSTNKKANKINNHAMKKLKGSTQTYHSSVTVLNKAYSISQNDKCVEDEITLKVGAKVMLAVNLADEGVFNGSIGEVKAMDSDCVLVDFGGREVLVLPHEWAIQTYDTVLKDGKKKPVLITFAKYKQIPLKLAFAITIHKSQGQTFAKAVIHPNAWMPGQLYVALSRVSKADGLYLSNPIKTEYLKADKAVLDFYNSSTEPNFVTKLKPVDKKRKPGQGRKKKFSGLETKVMRLPADYEAFFINLSETLSDKGLNKEEFEAVYQLAIEQFDRAFSELVNK